MALQGPGIDPAVLDDIINRLLEVRSRPGKQVQLSESEIRQLCGVSKEIFLQQPNLLELEAPIKICGEVFPTDVDYRCASLDYLSNLFLDFIPLLIWCWF